LKAVLGGSNLAGLNCQPHDVPALVSSRLLKPLGNSPPNGIKFFCMADVWKLLKYRFWLTKVTNIINQHWHRTVISPGSICRWWQMANSEGLTRP
jgi:hypothetical protein